MILLLALVAFGTGITVQAAQNGEQDTRIPFPRPDSHQGNWLEYHGKTTGAEGNSPGQPGNACLICHDRTVCIACHTTTMPRDHTTFWRTRSHGLMADANRERCLACHRQDYCVRCHSETAPRSHTASWRTRHCTWCHFGAGLSLEGNNCTVCHRQRVSHVPPPHPVNAGVDCTQCHQ